MADNRPPTLDEWKNIIINPTAPFCDQFKKIPRAFALIFQFFSWAFEADGKTPTADFLATIGGTGTVVPGVAPGQVVGVTASSGLAGYIYVSWQAVAGATKYYLYRSTSDDITGATNLGSVTGLTFAEKDVAGGGTLVDGTTYYYWVKAWNSDGYGPASVSVTGSCIAGAATTVPVYASGNVTVPVGCTKMTVYCWGAGGGGGYGDFIIYSPWWPVDQRPQQPGATYGGGGGGGGYATEVDYAVTAGQTVTVVIGNGGSPGGAGSESSVTYDGTVVTQGTGGSPGGTHAGGAGGYKATGTSGSTGSTGAAGYASSAGAGGSAGNSAGLPSGEVWGQGGSGGASSGSQAGAQPTYGQNGFVKLVFS